MAIEQYAPPSKRMLVPLRASYDEGAIVRLQRLAGVWFLLALSVPLLLCFRVLEAEEADHGTEAEAQTALHAAKENERHVASLSRASFRQHFTLPSPPVEVKVEFGWDSLRLFQRLREGERDDRRVFDGQKARLLNVTPRDTELYIRAERDYVLGGWPSWHLNSMFPLLNHWWTGPEGRAAPSQYNYMGTAPLNGEAAFLFAGLGRTAESEPMLLRVWVNRAGRVIQFEEYVGGVDPKRPVSELLQSATLRRRAKLSAHEDIAGCYVPLRIEIEGFGKYASYTLVTDIAHLGTAPPEALFRLDVPEGTKVHDRTQDPPLSYEYSKFKDAPSPTEIAKWYERSRDHLARAPESEPKQSSLIGKRAPAIMVEKWLKGEPITLADVSGNWVVLDFFSIACGPCLGAIPDLNGVLEEFEGKRLCVLAIHSYAPEAAHHEILEYIADHNIQYAVGVSSSGRSDTWGSVFEAYGVDGIPHAVLIDPEGRVVKSGPIWEILIALRKGYYWKADDGPLEQEQTSPGGPSRGAREGGFHKPVQRSAATKLSGSCLRLQAKEDPSKSRIARLSERFISARD